MISTWLDGLALNALMLLLAFLLDRLLPEPPSNIHPVVWMGRTINLLKRPAPQRPVTAFLYGCVIVILVVTFWAGIAYVVADLLRAAGAIAYVLGGTLILRTTFTVRGLSSAANSVCDALKQGRLNDGREGLKHLVSRDSSSLTAPLVAAAAIESVAENTTDSYVAPWIAFAIFGLPGAVAYRAINTLDSMLGHRGRYEYLGKASARLDDVVNLIPARVSALLILVAGALSRLPSASGWKILIRDRKLTASPNAGWTMSAMAGLLGSRLEKVGHYCLGWGMPEPKVEDINKAVRMAEIGAILGLVTALGLLATRHAIVALI